MKIIVMMEFNDERFVTCVIFASIDNFAIYVIIDNIAFFVIFVNVTIQ